MRRRWSKVLIMELPVLPIGCCYVAFLRRAVKVPMLFRILPCALIDGSTDDRHANNFNDGC